jgi:hypothetical protein
MMTTLLKDIVVGVDRGDNEGKVKNEGGESWKGRHGR